MQEGVLAPEARGRDGGSLADKDGGNNRDDEDGETDTGADARADEVTDDEAKELGEDKASVVDRVADTANLVDGVPPAVQGVDEHALGPNGVEKGNVVDESVNSVEEHEADLAGVEHGDEERGNGDNSDNGGARDLLAPVRVDNHGDHDLEEGKDAGEAKEPQRDEEEGREEVGSGHLGQSGRVGVESGAEGGQAIRLGGVHAEVAHDTHDGQGRDDLNGRVAEGNDEGVLDGVGVFGGVRGVGHKVAETNTDGEEHLTESILPDTGALEGLGAPGTNIEGKAVRCVGQGQRADSQDEDENQGKGHGDVDDATSETNTLEHAHPIDEPGEKYPGDGLANDARAGVRDHLRLRVANWRRVLDDLVVEEVGRLHVRPGQWAGEGVAEVDHGPGENGHVVADDAVAVEDHGETETLGAVVHAVPGADAARAVGLSDDDFEAENGDTDEEEGNEVRDEELQAVVVVDDGGESEQVSKTDGTAHGAEHVLPTRVEVVTAILVLASVWGNLQPDPLAETLLGDWFRHLVLVYLVCPLWRDDDFVVLRLA